MIISLLDDAASAYAQEAIPNSNPYISQQQWRYLSNSSCYEIKLVRRAEEVELGDEMALCTPQSACEPCPKELVRSRFHYVSSELINMILASSYMNLSANPSATAASFTVCLRHRQATRPRMTAHHTPTNQLTRRKVPQTQACTHQ